MVSGDRMGDDEDSLWPDGHERSSRALMVLKSLAMSSSVAAAVAAQLPAEAVLGNMV